MERGVLGVDGCRGGWVGALWRADDDGPVVLAAATFDALVAAARAATGEPTAPAAGTALPLVAVDIPIGLPDSGPREADRLARQALPGRASSVFPTLVRPAYEAPDYAAARSVAVEVTGRSASAQAFALGRKVLEVDAWLRSPGHTRVVEAHTRVVEVHPEVSFAAMNGGVPIAAAKKTPEGAAARRTVLASAGMRVPRLPPGLRGVGDDDLVDACAVAWTARRVARGEARSLPDPPEIFSDGVPAAIWV